MTMQLSDLYTPGTILLPREDAPKEKIWCQHCSQFIAIGPESVSHQNLVRQSKVCMDCGRWTWVDEQVEIPHIRDCRYPKGQMVKLGYGGSQSRTTVAPPRTATQEEAASWPHEVHTSPYPY